MIMLQALADVLFGWFAFVLRVLPDVSIRWDGVAIFIAGFSTALVCARSLLNWLAREVSPNPSTVQARWSWTATGALLMMFLLVFVIGISLVGITHQTLWLASSPESLYDTATQSPEDSASSIYRPGKINPNESPGNWVTAMIPYTPYALYDYRQEDPVRHDQAWNAPANARLFQRPMPLLINPSLSSPLKSPDGFGLSHFAGNRNVFEGSTKKLAELEVNTMLVAEVNAGFIPWGHPNQCRDLKHGFTNKHSRPSPERPLGFGPTLRRKTVLMLMADGSTREVSVDAHPSTLVPPVVTRDR